MPQARSVNRVFYQHAGLHPRLNDARKHLKEVSDVSGYSSYITYCFCSYKTRLPSWTKLGG